MVEAAKASAIPSSTRNRTDLDAAWLNTIRMTVGWCGTVITRIEIVTAAIVKLRVASRSWCEDITYKTLSVVSAYLALMPGDAEVRGVPATVSPCWYIAARTPHAIDGAGGSGC